MQKGAVSETETSSTLSDPGNPYGAVSDLSAQILLTTYFSDVCSTFLLLCYIVSAFLCFGGLMKLCLCFFIYFSSTIGV